MWSGHGPVARQNTEWRCVLHVQRISFCSSYKAQSHFSCSLLVKCRVQSSRKKKYRRVKWAGWFSQIRSGSVRYGVAQSDTEWLSQIRTRDSGCCFQSGKTIGKFSWPLTSILFPKVKKGRICIFNNPTLRYFSVPIILCKTKYLYSLPTALFAHQDMVTEYLIKLTFRVCGPLGK